MKHFVSIIQNLKDVRIPFLSSFQTYFDLGTSNTRIGIRKKGIVLRAPTYVGYHTKNREYLFYGEEAKTILGKTPDFLSIVRPITHGILADFDAEVALLQEQIRIAVHPYLEQFALLKPPIRAIATTPSIATEIERKAVEESLEKSGCTEVTLVDRAIATAAGCGYDIFSHEPRMVIDLGGGLFEISIVSGGGLVGQRVLKNAGEHMNKLIAHYTYLKHGIVLGENTCESLKIELLNFSGEEKTVPVRGKSLETGLPKSIKLKTSDIREAIMSQFHAVIDATRELIENSQPEVADAIFKNGITLAGKMAGIPGIDNYMSKELSIETSVSGKYQDATITGLIELDKLPEAIARIRTPTY